jgi:hypothetical protein
LDRNHDAEIRYLDCNREQRIFVARRLAELPIKLKELAEEFEVSRERVRQSATNAVPSGRRAQRLHPAPTRAVRPPPNVVNCWKILCRQCRMDGVIIPG